MTKLEKATLILPSYHTEPFRKAFEEAEVTLPSVKTLILGPHMDWIVSMCPDVETVSTHDWRWGHTNVDGNYNQRHSFDLIKAAGRAEKLQHFELGQTLDAKLSQAMLESIPNISSLAITSGMSGYSDSIEHYLPTFSKFTNLTTLTTAGSFSLGVGFDPPWCGNAYMGPGGDKLSQQVEEEGHQADLKVARMLFSACPKLELLWIGDHARGTVVRDGDGGVVKVDVEPGQRDSPTYWPSG